MYSLWYRGHGKQVHLEEATSPAHKNSILKISGGNQLCSISAVLDNMCQKFEVLILIHTLEISFQGYFPSETDSN